MTAPHRISVALLAAAFGMALGTAQAQDKGETIESHLAAAKAAAGFDFTGTLARVCIHPQTAPGADRAPGPAPARAEWLTEPAKVFDNFYFVGTKIHSSWALASSEGIILIDTLYEYALDDAIVRGLKKVGLDPANVKYTIISHAHGDHVGGARMMQATYHSRIVMGEKDWQMVEQSVNGFPNGKPVRDIVATDGMKITVGDVSVTLISTPGHTPDTYSLIFQVKDNGNPLTVAYSGGTAFNFVNDVPHFDIYIASQRKMRAAAAAAKATILMSNHSEFDNAVTKIRMMPSRKGDEPSPFEIGAEAVDRYFQVTEQCALAARLKLLHGPLE